MGERKVGAVRDGLLFRKPVTLRRTYASSVTLGPNGNYLVQHVTCQAKLLCFLPETGPKCKYFHRKTTVVPSMAGATLSHVGNSFDD